MEVIRAGQSGQHYVDALPFHKGVPRELKANKEYRRKILTAAEHDVELQRRLIDMSKADILFFLNLFAYVIEPRKKVKAQGMRPFTTWSHQEPVIASLEAHFGERHSVGDKSRAQGFTWILVWLYAYHFTLDSHCYLGFGSKNMETADDANDPNSIGWKIDKAFSVLPGWMRPPNIEPGLTTNRSKTNHTWVWPERNNYLTAFAATEGIGRGGRFTSFGLDESAFFPKGDEEAVHNLLETTDGLIMVSTPNGMENEHYRRVMDTDSDWLRLVLDWRDNPDQNRGLYRTENGQVLLMDTEYKFPKDYEFITDGRIRSPWYDQKWKDHGRNDMMCDQELNREYRGSKGRPFDEALLKRCEAEARPPSHRGMLSFHEGEPHHFESHEWVDGEAYPISLWCPLNEYGMPPTGKYVIGGDIATGVGGDKTSNSVASIWRYDCGIEQVGEFAANNVPPNEFAEIFIALAYWFGRGKPETYLIWEKNGPGVFFTNAIIDSGYPKVYTAQPGKDERKYAKKSDRPGYHNSDMRLVLAPLLRVMHQSTAKINSPQLIEECGRYVYDDQTSKPIHPGGKNAKDGGSRGESHGDRVVAAGMAVRGIEAITTIAKPNIKERPHSYSANSIQGRFDAWLAQQESADTRCDW